MQGNDKGGATPGRIYPQEPQGSPFAGGRRPAAAPNQGASGEGWEAADAADRSAGRPPARERAPRSHRQGPAARSNLVPLLLGVIALLVLIVVGLSVAYFAGMLPPVSPGKSVAANTAAADQAQVEVVKQELYGDWNYVCFKPSDGGDVRCSISQQLSDTKSNAPVFRWRILRDAKGGMVGEWDARSGIVVSQGIVLDAGWDKPARIPFQTCLPEGCRAVAALDPDAVARLSRTEKAIVTLFPIGGSTDGIKLNLSVKGLPEALAALQQGN